MEVSRRANDVITPTCDMEIINPILRHIWKDIAPVGVEPFDVPYSKDVTYFLVNDCDGVIVFHRFRDGVKIHPNILPHKRGKSAYNAVEDSIVLMFDNNWPCIYAEIDPKLRHVVMFARQLGFRLLERSDRDLFIRRNLNS